jgi:hypothetical protein
MAEETDVPIELVRMREALRKRLEANGVKKGTNKAQLIEMEFLQGFCHAHVVVADDGKQSYTKAVTPYMLICMFSGRSILE